jgi:Flp pilus assembly protein CpaB
MIIAAILFAAIAAVLLFAALRSNDDGGSASGATTDTVVASEDIGPNTRITSDMLETRAIADDQVLTGAYASIDDVEGLVARYPIQAGAQVTSASIGTDEIQDENDIGLVVPAGKRAFSVNASEVTSVGGLLLAGNRVDVLVVFPEGFVESLGDVISDPQVLEDVRAETLFQNIEVLAVAQEAYEPLPAPEATPADGESTTGTSGTRPDDIEAQPDASTITLSVSPQQAGTLALLMDAGANLWLTLRPAGDDSNVPPIDVNPLDFINP